MYVSILVFVELALDGRGISGRTPPSKVSILVFVELALDACGAKVRKGYQPVSILVFVELALDVDGKGQPHLHHLVSILVFVELALDAQTKKINDLGIGFQSLFSWNLLLMSYIRPHSGPSPSSFNPCFRGTCS